MGSSTLLFLFYFIFTLNHPSLLAYIIIHTIFNTNNKNKNNNAITNASNNNNNNNNKNNID